MASTKIIPKKSTVVDKIPKPKDLEIGEIAINIADGKIYSKDSSDTIVNLTGALELHEHSISQIKGLQETLDKKLGVGEGGDIDIDSGKITETTKLFFTDKRAQEAISVTGDLSYKNGVMSFTETYSTPVDIKTAYESNSDTNNFSNSDKSKLDGIEKGATKDQTKSDIDALNINADKLDGKDSSEFLGANEKAVNSDKLEGKDADYYRDASNLNKGVVGGGKVLKEGAYGLGAKSATRMNDFSKSYESGFYSNFSGTKHGPDVDGFPSHSSGAATMAFQWNSINWSKLLFDGGGSSGSSTNELYLLSKNFGTLKPWVRIHHSGNFDPNSKLDKNSKAVNSDKLNGNTGGFYRNASNLNAGTVPDSRLPTEATRWPDYSEVTGKPSSFPPDSHNHDNRYHTKSESDSLYLGVNDTATNSDKLGNKSLTTVENDYKSYADTAISDLVGSSPEALDTLNELAAALGDDPDFAATINNKLSNKLEKTDYNASDILSKLKTVDGKGSGLDADKLDGKSSGSFATSSQGSKADSAVQPSDINNVRNVESFSKDESDERFTLDLPDYFTRKSASEVSFTGEANDNLYRHLRGGSGSESLTFKEAIEEAANLGVRLPTIHELQSEICRDTGGGFDSSRVWTCTKVPGKPGYFYTASGRDGTVLEEIKADDTNTADGRYVANVDVPEIQAKDIKNLKWDNVNNKPDTATRWPKYSEVTDKPLSFPPESHNHDDKYYTKSQSNSRYLGSSDKAVDSDKLDGKNSTQFATSSQGSKADSAVQPGELNTVATSGRFSDLKAVPTEATRWPKYSEVTGKPNKFKPESHKHSASDITSGTFDKARLPTLGIGDVNFANQKLNKNSNVEFTQALIGGVADDGINSHQVSGGSHTDTLAVGGVEDPQESIDTDGNVQIRNEGQMKMGDFAIQYNTDTKCLDFNFLGA